MTRFAVTAAMLATFVVTAMLAGCGSSAKAQGWPPSLTKTMLASCQSGDQACVCIVHQFEKTLSVDEAHVYAKATLPAQLPKPLWEKVTTAMALCGAYK